MSDEKRAFTVKDHRKFTPGGDVRESEAEAPAEAPPPPTQGAAPEPPPPAEVDFASFVLSLAAQAGSLLAKPDLAGARQMISILEMLQAKTEGRRTVDEDRVLEALLYELRMAFLERSRAVTA